jgi:hypothetical protein
VEAHLAKDTVMGAKPAIGSASATARGRQGRLLRGPNMHG